MKDYMEFAQYTNQGDRDNNEDYCNVAKYFDSYCFVVADGLGGHGGGEIASMTAVDSICELFCEEGFSDSFFEKAALKIQDRLSDIQKENVSLSKMKTTMVVLIIHEGMMYCGHIGDSRLYYLKSGGIRKVTIDHSVPGALASTGRIKKSEIRNHADRNRLLRVFGGKEDVPEFDLLKPIKIAGFQALLLCTDGFWELIEDEEIEMCLKNSSSPAEWTEKMAQIIKHKGEGLNMDNFTAIAVISKQKRFLGLL